ncbi:MAG: ABC transporter substrate-binding protein [Bacteroidales bacterium]|nr:ABC transporter substrate-binding protein [Bacteroidales bacterium]MBR0304034.1 ABC transporter substrate-binding protein [Bacteroidales bacterium]
MMKLIKKPIILLGMLVMVFTACHSPKTNQSQEAFFTWEDSYKRHIELTKAPERIVSISPAITEVMFLVGAQNKLVGISDFCVYPPETEKIAKIGGMHNINFEVLLSLHPDVVLIGSMISQKDVEAIEKMGIPVICIVEETSMEGMADMMEVIGRITQCEEKANSEAAKWRDEVKGMRQENTQDTITKKKVYYVVGFGDTGDFTAPKNTHINEIIELAGCENVGKTLSSWNISREVLFKANPDIILIRKEDKDAFCSQHPYTLLKAVKENHVYPIESGWIDIVSPRNIKAVKMIRNIKNDYPANGE